jgi:hypothetical protein
VRRGVVGFSPHGAAASLRIPMMRPPIVLYEPPKRRIRAKIRMAPPSHVRRILWRRHEITFDHRNFVAKLPRNSAHGGGSSIRICLRIHRLLPDIGPYLSALFMRLSVSYCATPSTVKARNFAYLSPIFRASLYSAELRHA